MFDPNYSINSKLLFQENLRHVIWIALHLILVASAIGIQRTILTIFSGQFELLNSAIISAAITISVFGFTKSLGNFFGGYFSDFFGRKLLVISGYISLLIGTAFILLSTTLVGFILGNFFIGIGTGLVFVTSTILLTDISSLRERSTAISLMELSVYLGTAIGSITVFGGVDIADLVIGYFISALFLIIGLTLIILKIEDTKNLIQLETEVETSDFKIQKVFDMYYKELGLDVMESNLDNTDDTDSLEDTIISLKPFDPSNKYEGIYADLMGNYYTKPTFLIVLITGVVTRIIDSLIILVLPLMLLFIGFSLAEYSLLNTVYLLSWAMGIMISIKITQGYGRKFPLIIGLLIQAFGLLIFTITNYFPIFMVGAILAGVGLGSYYPLPSSIVTDIVPARQRGQAVGFFRLFLDMGYIIGSAIWVFTTDYLYDWLLPRITVIDNQNVYTFNFVIAFLILLFHALLTLLFLKETRPIWKQKQIVNDHINLILKVFSTINAGINGKKFKEVDFPSIILKAKSYERKADKLLDILSKETYLGSFSIIDSIDILRFSTKLDESAGYIIRAMRRISMLSNTPLIIFTYLQKYIDILEVLVDALKESLEYLSIGVSISYSRSFQVSTIEEVLDEIYRILWLNLQKQSKNLNSFELLIMKDVIDSMENSANIVDDCAELLRILALKHLA
jgi:MFS family permease